MQRILVLPKNVAISVLTSYCAKFSDAMTSQQHPKICHSYHYARKQLSDKCETLHFKACNYLTKLPELIVTVVL